VSLKNYDTSFRNSSLFLPPFPFPPGGKGLLLLPPVGEVPIAIGREGGKLNKEKLNLGQELKTGVI